MAKLAKQYYYNHKGERKINCFKINIAKEIVEKAGIGNDDEVKVYSIKGKIIIEKVSKGE